MSRSMLTKALKETDPDKRLLLKHVAAIVLENAESLAAKAIVKSLKELLESDNLKGDLCGYIESLEKEFLPSWEDVFCVLMDDNTLSESE
ncbi:MAG: hypothetical protein DRJ03_24090 [Chloroflexi bacterium]|nr:MAG: hypothetical protein DRJ03_24090 [Chloroflexota bacterium]